MKKKSMTSVADPWLHAYFKRFMVQTSGDSPSRLRICFLVGSADISGGTYVILQHAMAAQRRGHEVTIATHFPLSGAAPNWHVGLSELTLCGIDELADSEFDIAIATWWRTVYELPKVRSSAFIYFVQSAEQRFHAHEDDQRYSQLAAYTYALGLPTITIALWLQAYLHFAHQTPAFCVRNGIDKSTFTAAGARLSQSPTDGRLRVLVEGAIDVPMKDNERAIECAASSGAEVWLLTPSDIDSVDGVDRVISRLPVNQVAAVYRSCDVLLKLSRVEGMYGPPLEMFHCGGTVVTNDVTGSDEYVRHGQNGLVVPTGDSKATVDALRLLESDRDYLARLRAGAGRTAADWPDWSQSSREFVDLLELISKFENPRAFSSIQAIKAAGSEL